MIIQEYEELSNRHEHTIVNGTHLQNFFVLDNAGKYLKAVSLA